MSLHILFLLKHLATNFTRELCHLFDTLEEICLQLLLIRKIPVTPDLPLNIKLNFVTLDFDSVVAHVNFGMLTLQKVKL